MDSISIPEKQCTGCLQLKPVTEFYLQTRAQRFQARCKVCDKARKQPDYLPILKPCKIFLCPVVGRKCSYCEQVLPPSKFYNNKAWADGIDRRCKQCRQNAANAYYQIPEVRERMKANASLYAKTDKAKVRNKAYQKIYNQTQRSKELRREVNLRRKGKMGIDGRRNAQLKTRFGMTLEGYNKMLERQDGCCAICGITAERSVKGRLAVDHDHGQGGTVRELLCIPCNTGLGHFKDSPDIVASAARYLLKHRQLKLVM